MNLQQLIKHKFRGHEQIGYLDNEQPEVRLQIFKVSEDSELVYVYDGDTAWIANPKYCLFNMKPGVSPSFHQVRLRTRINVEGTRTRRILSSQETKSNSPKIRRSINAN